MRFWDTRTIKKIRRGYFSAVYFNRTKYILEQEKNLQVVTMQVFQKNAGSILCGTQEVKELFKVTTGFWNKGQWINKFSSLTIEVLPEASRLNSWEPVLHITGPYIYFAHLESVYLGILARRTLVASNVCAAVKAARGKPVLFFADRFDHFLNQEGDGYAALVGGATGVCTRAQIKFKTGQVMGTIPHALIAINSGSTTKAVAQFAKHLPNIPLVALVDFDNDCVYTALGVAQRFKRQLWGIRLDTAHNLIDKSLKNLGNKPDLYGVNPTLVNMVRQTLDKAGFSDVKIIVSGGFDASKIKLFEKAKTPVDIYAVGSTMVKGNNDFTADIVMVDGKKIAKYGRSYTSLPLRKSPALL